MRSSRLRSERNLKERVIESGMTASESEVDSRVALPRVDEGGAPVEEIGVAVVDESGEETAEIRMEFGARWHGIDREEQKAVVE
jgi:hypothetical protein